MTHEGGQGVMRAALMIVGVATVLVLALGGLEAIASRLPVATPLPKTPAPATWR
jgi:hypothetical protein